MAEHIEGLKTALNAFSVDIYHQIAAQSTETGNIFLSPLSIASALLLVHMGAKGATKQEISYILHLDKTFVHGQEAALHQALEELLQVFVPGTTKEGQPAYSLAMANKAFVQNGLTLKQEFVRMVTKDLKSEIGQVEFQKSSEAARQEINQWVESKTNNKIKDLLPAGSVKPNTLLALINAIYFKADWMEKFDEQATEKTVFHNLDGKDVTVSLMSKWAQGKTKYAYYENSAGNSSLPPFQMLAIPYKQREMSMLVFLPRDAAGLKALEAAINADSLKAIHEQVQFRKVNIFLPRFKLEESINLGDVLQKMGVNQVFGEQADLSGISDARLSVSSAVHKAFVEVNEEGTEAAAATGMIMTLSLMPEDEEPIDFRADHPFIFAIRHEATGFITFLGRVVKF